MSIKIPYMRKKILSTFLPTLSIAILLLPLLLASSPMLFFNLQAVQASSSYPISYQTTKPAGGYTSCTSGEVWLTFDAQGYYNSVGDGNVNSGKFQMTDGSGKIVISGDMNSGGYDNSTGSGGRLTIVQLNFDNAPKGCSSNPNLVILTSCSSSDDNLIRFSSQGNEDFSAQFSGPVKCSLVGNTNTTQQQQQPSPMTGTTTTTQTSMSFKTTQLAYGNLNIPSRASASLTFDAQGTASSSDSQSANITSGKFQVTGVVDGSIDSGTFTNETRGGVLSMIGTVDVVHNCPTNPCVLEKGTQFGIISGCSVNSVPSSISMFYVDSGIDFGDFNGAVECSSHGDTTTHSSMAGSTQDREIGNSSRDGDRDGIPDSSDNCTHNSNHRCYKEGDTSNTTQQPPTSSNRTGNQTR
jgi:hypothetical protein